MRKTLSTLFVALAGLAFGLGADSGDDASRKLLLVFSADERSELAPCG